MAVMKYSLPANAELRTRFKNNFQLCSDYYDCYTVFSAYVGKMTDFRMELFTLMCCAERCCVYFHSLYCIVLFLLIYNQSFLISRVCTVNLLRSILCRRIRIWNEIHYVIALHISIDSERFLLIRMIKRSPCTKSLLLLLLMQNEAFIFSTACKYLRSECRMYLVHCFRIA